MKIIPKTFEVFGKKFVVSANGELEDYGIKGRAHEQRARIELDLGMSNFDEQDVEVTYLHEVVHIILDSIAMDDLSKDEQFVGLLSRALHQWLLSSGIWQDSKPKPKRKRRKKVHAH